MGYYDNVNTDLLEMVPPDAKKVCEVGCGAGEFAKAYKAINPDCEYYGIELNFTAAKRAEDSGVFKSVRIADVEKTWNYNLDHFDPDLDAIICGDLIEHLKDPWEFLARATKEWLAPGGQVVTCVPNSQNYTLIGNLLGGAWHYQDEGLLDRTHLRFFTRSSIEQMFADAGLTVTSIEPRNWSSEFDSQHAGFVKAMEMFIEGHGLDKKTFSRDTRAFQWLVRAVKDEAPNRKMLIRSFAANYCCGRPRLSEPGKFLATIPGVRYVEAETEVREGESPVAIVQRDKFDIEQVRKWIHSGVLVIGEWDDFPGYFKKNTETDYLPLRGVHALSVSTEMVANTVSIWNPNVGVFHNQMASLPPIPEKRTGPIRILAAWQNRSDGWHEILDPLNDALADHPTVEMIVIHDREFYHALKTENKTFYSFQTYDKYIEVLRRSDIALLPMSDDEFSKHKSDIKLLECAANGVATLASEDSIYFKSAYDSRNGFTYRTIADFRHYLSFLINCIRERDHFAANGRSYITNHRMLKDVYRDRYRWIKALLDTREELTEQLYERCPELKL